MGKGRDFHYPLDVSLSSRSVIVGSYDESKRSKAVIARRVPPNDLRSDVPSANVFNTFRATPRSHVDISDGLNCFAGPSFRTHDRGR